MSRRREDSGTVPIAAAYLRALSRLRRPYAHEVRDLLNGVQLNLAVAESARQSEGDPSPAFERARRGVQGVQELVLAVSLVLDPATDVDGDLTSVFDRLERLVGPLWRALRLGFCYRVSFPTGTPAQGRAVQALLVSMVDLACELAEAESANGRELAITTAKGVEGTTLRLGSSPGVGLGDDGGVALEVLRSLGWSVRETPGEIELVPPSS